MKKKIINGILLVAMLFATSSAFVSCKDNDADSQTEMLGKIANLQNQITDLKGVVGPQGPQGPAGKNGADGLTPFIGENGNWWIGTTDTGVAAKGADGQNGADGQKGADGQTPFIGENGNWWIGTTDTGVRASGSTEIMNKLEELETQVGLLNITVPGLAEEIENLQKQIDALAETIETLYGTPITGIEINKITNPYFALDTPLGIESKLLIALYGEVKKDITFTNPLTGETTAFEAGKVTNNVAGKIYMTINPYDKDFTNKPNIQLVNTAGEAAPVNLTPLQASDVVLTRDASGLYVTEASIATEDLEKIEFNYLPEDLQAMKDAIKAAIKQRNRVTVLNLANEIWNVYAKNSFPLYQIQADWTDGSYKSKADINAISLKPFSYDFDLNDAAKYDETSINALERLESYAVKVMFDRKKERDAVWRFLDKFNANIAEKVLNNVNNAIQPTLLIADTEGNVWHTIAAENRTYTNIKAGEITLLPTSWTAELVAPAFKKFVAVTEIDGSADAAELAKVNVNGLGKLQDGSVKSIPLTIEAGKTYKIQYTAIDYFGRTRDLFYIIKGA